MKKGRPDHWAEAMAGRVGLSGALDFTPANVGQTLHLPCARGHRVDFYVSKRLPPEVVAKKMMQKGWTVGSRLLCPEHSRKPKKAEATPPQHKEDETMTMAAPVHPAPKRPASRVLDAVAGHKQPDPPAPTVAAREARRLAIAGLDEGYDLNNERYNPGWNDARIAKECGIGEAAVAKLREELYGPLGEPAELVTLRDEMAALDRQCDAFAADLLELGKKSNALRGRFEALCRKNGWAV